MDWLEYENKNNQEFNLKKIDELKNEIKKSILEEKNQNLDETLNIEHLTLNEMSKITKIAPQTLQKMEQPDSNPTLDSINKLLNAFGLKFIIKSK